ncbi:FHA domain-containing protein [Prosthecobacter sp.]|uniref:FHA domain-containing protein n=1 Tax=Prosthecobacter sp. TaxID=1965333 RepID=UPI00248888C9|nr:FHA domain-containing protein [Prosthecobacter sp.]MDI1312405.1 FHA domain-containing protein [Prosthecobacter sp.]
MAKLTFVLEDGQEVVVPLKEHITLGRDEDNDIVVDDERISSHHAEIVENADGSLQVFDLKSTAGTFVNGERQLSCTLLHGDTIAFGPLVGTLDLEHPATSPPPAKATPAAPPVSNSTVKVPVSEALAPPAPPASAPPDNAHVEATAQLEAEKSRLKAEVAAAEKELREWEKRAEKERSLHLSRVESLTAEEEKLAPAQAAVQQAETAHREWLEAINSLTSQHADKTTALERLNTQHYEKSTEVQRLTATAAEAQQQIENLAAQKEQTDARLKQVRDECEQDEALLNSLRQQIIEHEKRIVEEEAKHLSLSTSSAALSAKQQSDEASIRDLESLLMKLEQRAATAEASLQHQQEELASCEKKLAARNAELAASNSALAVETDANRTELEQRCATAETSLQRHQEELASYEKKLAALNAELTARNASLAVETDTNRAELEHRCAAAEASLRRQQEELASCEKKLAARNAEFAARNASLAAETNIYVETDAKRAELEQLNEDLASTKQQLFDGRKRLAAVEQRYRDAQSDSSQGGSQIAPSRRQPHHEDASQTDATTNGALPGQIEAARRELAELEAKIASMRKAHSAAAIVAAQDASNLSPPVVVQVETIRLAPVTIKSERTRGPGTKKAEPRS